MSNSEPVHQIFSRPGDLHPIFQAKAGYNDVSFLQKVAFAVGSVLSKMGYLAFSWGILVSAVLLLPISLGAAETAALILPAYLAMAGASGFLVGEIAKHISEKRVTQLTFSA